MTQLMRWLNVPVGGVIPAGLNRMSAVRYARHWSARTRHRFTVVRHGSRWAYRRTQ